MKNPFIIFDLPPAFEIDTQQLVKRYRELVRTHHPDISTHNEIEDINAAYQILKNLIKRARALLELQGINIDDEHIQTDPALLEEMFTVRELNDGDLIQQKQQEAQSDFNHAFQAANKSNMLRAYWRLLYLDKAQQQVSL